MILRNETPKDDNDDDYGGGGTNHAETPAFPSTVTTSYLYAPTVAEVDGVGGGDMDSSIFGD